MPINSISLLKAQFKAALDTNGKVGDAAADKLIASVKENGVTNSERRQLREQVIANADRFEPTAKAKLWDFIDNQAPSLLVDEKVVTGRSGAKDLDDPALPEKDRDKLSFDWTSGAVFKNGASAADVEQGMLGDCYAMSAFAAVAAMQPEKITEALKDNGDGTYTARFFDVTKTPKAEVHVTIDGELPTAAGSLRYARGADRRELWVPLLEKAYAQWKGGYDVMGKGGSPGDVMAALTGNSGGQLPLAPGDEKDIHELLVFSLKDKHALVASTHGEDQDAMYTGTGIYAEHGYTVLGAEEKDGKLFVTLRNPWGEVEPGGNGKDDGVFKLEMKDFVKLYANLFIC